MGKMAQGQNSGAVKRWLLEPKALSHIITLHQLLSLSVSVCKMVIIRVPTSQCYWDGQG